MTTKYSCTSVLEAMKLGAALGLAGALLYGTIFTIYGIVHTSAWILAKPANGTLPTLAANAVSVVIGAMFFAVLLGLIAALVQAVTLGMVFGISRRLNPQGSQSRGAWIGTLTAAALWLALLLFFRTGPQLLIQVFWNQSFFFWFGVPGALFVGMNAWLGSRLSSASRQPAEQLGHKDPVMAFTR